MSKEKKKRGIVFYTVTTLVFIIIYYLLHHHYFSKWENITPFLQKISQSLFMLSAVLLARNITQRLIINNVHNLGDRHNLLWVVRLIASALLVIIIVFTIFREPGDTLYSVGIISLVLGFALQAPIMSFIGWLYIIFRHPYQAGDRIEVKGHRGDVVEISYLDTSIMECSGDYLGNDRRSGRIIKIPNSLVLSHEIINYSGDQIPFIWNETAIQVAYTSDLKFVEKCLLEVTQDDFTEKHPQFSNEDQFQSTVYFRVNSYAWLEAVISYPVTPTDTTDKRNRILRNALPLLNAEPEKVQFPAGTHR